MTVGQRLREHAKRLRNNREKTTSDRERAFADLQQFKTAKFLETNAYLEHLQTLIKSWSYEIDQELIRRYDQKDNK